MVMMTKPTENNEGEKKKDERCRKCSKTVRYAGSKYRESGYQQIWQHWNGKKWTTNCSRGGKHVVGQS